MSKKKKHKKKFRAQLHQELQKIQQQPTVATEKPKNEKTYEPEESKVEKPKENIPETKPKFETPIIDKKRNMEKASNEYDYVKKDVAKIIMIMAICLVILVSIWLLSLKTPYISNFANTLANFSHLNQLE